MSKLFKNKYRIESTRLKGWDYSNAAAYFITICTKNREHFFGEIVNGKMQFSEIGKQVEIEWVKTLDIRPDMNLQFGEFVIMPNHFHAIIGIGKNEYNAGGNTESQFGPQSKNLASIVRGFKSSVTKFARIMNIDFQWQPGYHDHIIRNKKSFEKISNYIIDNPLNWNSDEQNNNKPQT